MNNKYFLPIAMTVTFIFIFSLAGCGVTQMVSNSTRDMAKSLFYKQIKQLQLDFTAREALNTNDNGAALSTIVRIYQLKNADSFNQSDYTTLFANDSEILKNELVAQKDLRIRPAESIAVNMPMAENAEFVAIAAMFHTPNLTTNDWRIVIPKQRLLPDAPRQLVLSEHSMTLTPVKGEK